MMNKKACLLFALLFTGVGFSAEVKDVSLSCGKSACDLVFKFKSANDLPSYYQKYNASKKEWTVAFAKSEVSFGEGTFEVDDASKLLKSVHVFKESGKQGELLKFVWSAGNLLVSDENTVSLKGAEFKISLPKASEKSWKLSSLIESQKRAKALAEKEALKKLSLEEKKRLAAEKAIALENAKAEKARKDSLAKAEKAAALQAEKEAKLKAAEERKAALEAAKAEKARKDSLAKAEKAARLQAEKEAKLKAAEERKAALEAAKAEKARLDSLSKAEKAILLEQKKLEKARADSLAKLPKVVSALIDGIAEMTSVVGYSLDQFELKMFVPISLDNVTYSENKNTVTLSVAGPEKSPVQKVNTGSFVKSLSWTKDGLVIQLSAGACPVLLNRDGALILQFKESVETKGFLYWKALPTGIHTRRWASPSEEDIPLTLESFASKYEKSSKKNVTSAQSFFLTASARELIVTAEEVELYEAPKENSTVLDRLVFGNKLENIDVAGLYYKVQYGPKIGFVNKRSVSFRDELSAVQSERLKLMASLRNDTEELNALDNDDRIIYSSYGRRDPFVDVKGLVEEGINIDQMELVGIIYEAHEPMAILSDVKNSSLSYTVKEGDKVLNGKVLKITQTDVLFLIQEFGVSRRYSMSLPDKYGGQK